MQHNDNDNNGKKSWLGTLRAYNADVYYAFGNIAVISAFLIFIYALFDFQHIKTYAIYYTSSFLILLITIAVLGYIGTTSKKLRILKNESNGLIIKNSELSSIADSIRHLHHINHIARDFMAKLNFYSDKKDDWVDYQKDLQSLLKQIADSTIECFSLITGRSCRCTIKEVPTTSLPITVVTVVRDKHSSQAQQNSKGRDFIHHLDDNIDFAEIWYREKRYYLCNNLLEEYKAGNYENSSFKAIGKRPNTDDIENTWPLPYKSTLVLPIRYIRPYIAEAAKTDGDSIVPERVWGYLTIDCNDVDVFNPTYAPEIGATIADLLFITLNSFENFKKR